MLSVYSKFSLSENMHLEHLVLVYNILRSYFFFLANLGQQKLEARFAVRLKSCALTFKAKSTSVNDKNNN